MEAERQVVDVPEDHAGKPSRRLLPDLFEQGIAQIVGKDSGKAGRGISHNQHRDDAERLATGGHAVDHRLVGERHQQDRCLAGEHQRERGDDSHPQLKAPLGPEHWQETPQRPEPGASRLFLL